MIAALGGDRAVTLAIGGSAPPGAEGRGGAATSVTAAAASTTASTSDASASASVRVTPGATPRFRAALTRQLRAAAPTAAPSSTTSRRTASCSRSAAPSSGHLHFGGEALHLVVAIDRLVRAPAFGPLCSALDTSARRRLTATSTSAATVTRRSAMALSTGSGRTATARPPPSCRRTATPARGSRVTRRVIGDPSLFDAKRGGPASGFAADVPDMGGQLAGLTYDRGSSATPPEPARFAADELMLTMRGAGIRSQAAAKFTATTPQNADELASVSSPRRRCSEADRRPLCMTSSPNADQAARGSLRRRREHRGGGGGDHGRDRTARPPSQDRRRLRALPAGPLLAARGGGPAALGVGIYPEGFCAPRCRSSEGPGRFRGSAHRRPGPLPRQAQGRSYVSNLAGYCRSRRGDYAPRCGRSWTARQHRSVLADQQDDRGDRPLLTP